MDSFKDHLKKPNINETETENLSSLLKDINDKRKDLKEKIKTLETRIKDKEGDEKQLLEFQKILSDRALDDLDVKEKIVRLKDRIAKNKEKK